MNLQTESGDVRDRVRVALERVRPLLAADGGDVWLARVENGVAYVQMVGACGGCAMVASTLEGAVTAAVRADVPEITRVEML